LAGVLSLVLSPVIARADTRASRLTHFLETPYLRGLPDVWQYLLAALLILAVGALYYFKIRWSRDDSRGKGV
jgi:hypothetical protein